MVKTIEVYRQMELLLEIMVVEFHLVKVVDVVSKMNTGGNTIRRHLKNLLV